MTASRPRTSQTYGESSGGLAGERNQREQFVPAGSDGRDRDAQRGDDHATVVVYRDGRGDDARDAFLERERVAVPPDRFQFGRRLAGVELLVPLGGREFTVQYALPQAFVGEREQQLARGALVWGRGEPLTRSRSRGAALP
jgi:hypothetical protein